MRLPLFMALRYLFSRKRVGAINIISGISVLGVAFGTAALLCTLSVFNGFRDLIGSLYTAFDPPLMVVPTQGKFATTDDPSLLQMMRQPEVKAASFTLEDHALILFRGRPTVITLKGVDDNYDRVTGIRSILYGTGRYELHRGTLNYGIPGIGLASTMGGIDYGTLQICAPRKGERINLANPGESFNADDITSPRVCFDVNQRKYDENYFITSLAFAQGLFEQPGCITALELSLQPSANPDATKRKMQQLAGQRFKVMDQLEQQQEVFDVHLVGSVFQHHRFGVDAHHRQAQRCRNTAPPRRFRPPYLPHFPLRGSYHCPLRSCHWYGIGPQPLLGSTDVWPHQDGVGPEQLHHRCLPR